ncbi:hypothetical protein TYRP_000831 [Tyrophagus putrescentiae]|nr:hypothetical protein TYRP_000831 [Tyrophagus putrescentiae]
MINAQHQTPQPLTATERSGGERDAAELDNDHLNDRRADEDAAEDDIGGNAREDVLLTVDLPTVDFIEERHEDEGVEDDGVVLRGGRRFRPVDTVVNVEEALTDKEQQHEDDKLMMANIVHVMMDLLRPYGLRSSSAFEGGSVLSANEPSVSMIRLTQSICTAFSGLSEMMQTLIKAISTATMFTVS